MKTVWKGSISFGLVTIPIELYSAVKEHGLGFKLLHKDDLYPITYKDWCEKCGKEVHWQDIVKGIKLSTGGYFALSPEKLRALKPEKTETIDITEFVDHDAVDVIFFEHHYYIVPAETGRRAFFLFAAALKKLHKCAIGRFVMRDKEYVCSINPFKNGLLLTTLNYNYEIRKVEKFEELTPPAIEPAELKLAEQLINKLSVKKFDIKKFKDTFIQKLEAKIKQKGVLIKKPKERVRARPIPASLMQALKKSLKQAGAPSRHVMPEPRAKNT